MSDYGVIISSVNFSGQTALVSFRDFDTEITFDLGYQTLPFFYEAPDGDTRGLFFLYFSATDETCIVVVGEPFPTPTVTPTPTITPTNTPDSGEVYAYIGPGSVIVDYEVSLNQVVSGNVSFDLIQQLYFNDSSADFISNVFLIPSGTTSANTQTTLSTRNFNNIVRYTEYAFINKIPSDIRLSLVTIFATPSPTPTNTQTPSQTPTQTSSETPTPTPTVTSTLL